MILFFFFSSRRRHTRSLRDWSSDVCSSDLRESRHILTLENPIEFLHRDVQSSVTQREVGADTTDFKMGLRAALRQDPDVIMIGEMCDAETVDTAIKAAETGHLLMSTLHTPDAQSTILRIMAMFAPEEQDIIRRMVLCASGVCNV